MRHSITFALLVNLVVWLGGCSYRFAVTTKRICNHPEEYRQSWTRLNVLHWHHGIHSKCKRCGQKFCEYWEREKLINKFIYK